MKCFNKIALIAIVLCMVNCILTGKEISNPIVQANDHIKNKRVTTIVPDIPAGTKVYYVNITDSAGNITSTYPVILGEKSSPVQGKKRIKFDNKVWQVPEITELESDSLSYPGIKAIYYKGLDYEGKETRVFAYIGFPANTPKDKKVPAVVLVHGGAGTAFPQWVKIWNDSGYAAIAMDLEGRQPIIPGNYQSTGNTGGPSNNHYSDINKKLEDQWMYHAVSDVYLAYSLMAADLRVDKNKIGISGISWGGVITSIAIGNSDCFAFAIPVYGCGYLQNSKGAMKINYTKEVAEQWDYSNWAGTVKTPSLWINGDSDFSFSIDATSESAKNTKNSSVVILPSYPHSHLDGWTPREIYTFANSVIKKRPGLVNIIKQPEENSPSFSYDVFNSIGIKSIELIYTTETIHYNAENKLTNMWHSIPVNIK